MGKIEKFNKQKIGKFTLKMEIQNQNNKIGKYKITNKKFTKMSKSRPIEVTIPTKNCHAVKRKIKNVTTERKVPRKRF